MWMVEALVRLCATRNPADPRTGGTALQPNSSEILPISPSDGGAIRLAARFEDCHTGCIRRGAHHCFKYWKNVSRNMVSEMGVEPIAS